MKAYFIFISILFISISDVAFSQDGSGPVRVEFTARADVFDLIPCSNKGALMFYESAKQVDNQNKAWVFIFYDKNLNALWSKEIPVIQDLVFKQHLLVGNEVYLAFQNMEKTRFDVHNFQLLKVNILDASFSHTGVFIPEKASLVDFDVSGNTFVLGLNYSKEKALAIIKDLETGNENTIKFEEAPTFLEDLKLNPGNNQLYVALNAYVARKRSTLYLNSYSLGGTITTSVAIAPAREYEKLMNAQINLNDNGPIFLLGTFNSLNGKLSRTEEGDIGEESEGFYIAKVVDNVQQFVKLHRLMDFKNFTEILNNQELADIKNIIQKNEKKDKGQSINYEFLIHDLYKEGEEFIMLAEAYYPEFHQISTMSYDFYGRPMPYYYTVFDGFRYFNAFVVSFDNEGNLNLSNGIKIWDMLTQRLQQKVEIYKDGENIVMFYNHQGNINSKVINAYNEVGDIEKSKIATSHSGDVQIEAGSGMIRHWYDDYFITYGYQTLRNSTLGGGTKRRVFYMNKLAFD
jgi:hypothetical protein